MERRFVREQCRPLAGLAAAIICLIVWGPVPARAVLIVGPTDTNGNPIGGQNLTAPTGALAGSGWDLEGTWQNSFTGTPIAPDYFITAAHLGGQVGDTFVLNGTDYTTTAEYRPSDGSDIAIWKVSGTFPTYAPIYSSSNELGQQLVVFGRSGGDGPATAPDGTPLHGWQWSNTLTGAESWGTNVVTYAGPVNVNGVTAPYLEFAFNSSLGPNTGGVASGDSGGGVFIQSNGVWMLAGINSSATGAYNTQPGDAPATSFNASLYDSRGLYFDGTTQLITGSSPVPSISLATRLSDESAWITSVTGVAVPEPSAALLLVSGLVLAFPVVRGRRQTPSESISTRR